MTAKNEKGRSSCKSATPNTTTENNVTRTSAKLQRDRLLSALRRGPVDTVRAYTVLGILHAPRRVFELRQDGHAIKTEWITRYCSDGLPHRVGRYRMEVAR